jgi:hypothetical protein
MLDQQTTPGTPHWRIIEPLLTLKKAADYLRLTPSAMYTQRHRSEKPGALGIRVGKKILYRLSDIDDFLNQRFADSTSRRDM